jgi:hypothetical protein
VRWDGVDKRALDFCPSSISYSTQLEGLRGVRVRRLGGFEGMFNAFASVVLP